MADCSRLTVLLAILGLTYVKASSSDLEPLDPVLCPHDDLLAHTCYEMSQENRTCIVITFGMCGQSHTPDRPWWIQDFCWSIQTANCTLFKCQRTCCDGWTTDEDGRCEKPVRDGDITCENGILTTEDKPKCECPSNFYGDRCEIPRCEGGCKNGGTCRVKSDESHQCHCPPPFSGENCETVTCLEPCVNGGTCVSNGAEAVCTCPPNYYGKTCAQEIDGTLCPMPNNTCFRRMHCRHECINTAGCPEGHVCCSDGCILKCMRPVTKTCRLGDSYYRAGERFSKDACNHCTCLVNGTIVCSEIKCPNLECAGGELSYEDGLCCPVCRGKDNLMPDGYTRPTFSRCYQGVVVPLNLSSVSSTYYLKNLNIHAWDFAGLELQVTYNPSSLSHCGCTKGERTTQMISISAVDRFGGRTECNFWAYVLDPIPPTFHSCPADIYAYEDEDIHWNEPRAQDNVGIQNLWSNIDQSERLSVGEHTVTYTAIDYDDNQATCEFNVHVYSEGTSDSQMPAGLRCRMKKPNTVGIVVGTICGGVAVVIVILVVVLILRLGRRHTQRSPRRNIHAVSNENYGVGFFPDYKGSSTKLPEYTPPSNPPAYDELRNVDIQDYKFANPPSYDETDVTGDNRTTNTGIYKEMGGDEKIGNSINNPIYGSEST